LVVVAAVMVWVQACNPDRYYFQGFHEICAVLMLNTDMRLTLGQAKSFLSPLPPITIHSRAMQRWFQDSSTVYALVSTFDSFNIESGLTELFLCTLHPLQAYLSVGWVPDQRPSLPYLRECDGTLRADIPAAGEDQA
jgi:hypothetical protein